PPTPRASSNGSLASSPPSSRTNPTIFPGARHGCKCRAPALGAYVATAALAAVWSSKGIKGFAWDYDTIVQRAAGPIGSHLDHRSVVHLVRARWRHRAAAAT